MSSTAWWRPGTTAPASRTHAALRKECGRTGCGGRDNGAAPKRIDLLCDWATRITP